MSRVFECSRLDRMNEEPFNPRWIPATPTHATMMAARKLLDEIRERPANDCRETPGLTAEDWANAELEGVHTWLCGCGLKVARVGGVLLGYFSPPHTHRCWHWQGGPR